MTKDKGKGGVPTNETRILACQCGGTKFDVKKRTKTSVSLVCAKCGLTCSVKGNLATVRVRQQEIEYALQNTIVTPDDTPADTGKGEVPGEKPGDGSGPTGEEYVIRKVRMLRSQAEVWDKSFECDRIAHCGDDVMRGQVWQGHTAERMAAEYLSGMPANVLQIYDAMGDAVKDAERIADEQNKKAPTARKISTLRSKVRDKLALESGILPPDFFGENPQDPDPRQLELIDGGKGKKDADDEEVAAFECPECGADVQEGDESCGSCGVTFSTDSDDVEGSDEKKGKKEFKPVPDDGKLYTAVENALTQYVEDAQESGLDGDDVPDYKLVNGSKPNKQMLETWAKVGGYMIRIYGDKRTVNDAGGRPCVTALVSSEPAGLALDFSIEYDEQTEMLGNGSVEVAEVLPPDYDKVGPWEQPHFADKREQL